MAQKCPSCGASVATDAKWCGQCYHRFDASGYGAAKAFREFEDPGAYRDEFHPRYSRWRKSSTTMGPVGRILATVLFFLPIAIFFFGGFYGIVGIAIWVIWILPRALRSIWKRVRVYG